MSDSVTKTCELSTLKSARDEIKIKDCSVVTWDEEWEKDGIKIVPAWKWCLGECDSREGLFAVVDFSHKDRKGHKE